MGAGEVVVASVGARRVPAEEAEGILGQGLWDAAPFTAAVAAAAAVCHQDQR